MIYINATYYIYTLKNSSKIYFIKTHQFILKLKFFTIDGRPKTINKKSFSFPSFIHGIPKAIHFGNSIQWNAAELDLSHPEPAITKARRVTL